MRVRRSKVQSNKTKNPAERQRIRKTRHRLRSKNEKGNNRKQAKESAKEHGKEAKGRKDPENRSEENGCGMKPKQKEERSHMFNRNHRGNHGKWIIEEERKHPS